MQSGGRSRAGKTIDEALAITADEVEAQLGGYPEKKKDYPERALEALQIAIDDYRAKVASGAVPDFGAMDAPARPAVVAAAASAEPAKDADGKITISLR